MRNTYKYYREKSVDFCKYALRKQGVNGRIEYSIYSMVSFVAKLILFLRPIFVIADTNIAKMIDEAHDFSIEKAFEGVKERYFQLLVAMIKVDLTALLIVSLCSVLGFWGYFFDIVSKTLAVRVIAVGSAIIFWGLAYIAGTKYAFSYAAIGYVSARNKELDTGDILLNSKRGMVNGCKKTIWFHAILNYTIRAALLVLLIIALVKLHDLYGRFAGEKFFILNMGFRVRLYTWVLNISGMVLVALYVFLMLFVFGPLNLKFEQTKYYIFADHVSLKKTYVVKQVPGEKEAYSTVLDSELSEKELMDLSK